MRRRSVAVAIVALSVGLAAVVAQPPASKVAEKPPAKADAQQAIEPRAGPGVGQAFLAKFVGDWDVAKAFYPRGGGEPTRANGECKQTMIHAGRFLQSEFTFGTGAAKTTGLGLIGFEQATGKFTSVWTDSRQTRMSFRQGREKFDGAQIVLYSQSLGEGEGRQSKTVTKLEHDGKSIVHRQFSVSADAPERLVMELVMTRKSTQPAAPAR